MDNKVESRIGWTGRSYETCIPEVNGLVQGFCRLKVSLGELGGRGKEDMSGPGPCLGSKMVLLRRGGGKREMSSPIVVVLR